MGGWDITFMEDMRSSSDIQDDDKTSEFNAPPPSYFKVINSPTTGWVRFSVLGNQSSTSERVRVCEYRVYFVPYSMGETDPANTALRSLRTPAQQLAAFSGALWVVNIDAAGRQNVCQADDNKFYNQKGWYFCVGVNRKGQEGAPTIAVASPYN